MKNENPIKETWRIRDELSAEYDYDVHRIFAALREEEKKHGDRLVRMVSRLAPEDSTAALREEPPKAGWFWPVRPERGRLARKDAARAQSKTGRVEEVRNGPRSVRSVLAIDPLVEFSHGGLTWAQAHQEIARSCDQRFTPAVALGDMVTRGLVPAARSLAPAVPGRTLTMALAPDFRADAVTAAKAMGRSGQPPVEPAANAKDDALRTLASPYLQPGYTP